MNESWSFGNVWNKSLEQKEIKPLTPRRKIWASELGGSYVDRFLKMNAVPFSNPPDPRALRKFEAGNIMEWIVGIVLRRAGILQDQQTYLVYEYPDLLPVNGKADFIAGGKPEWDYVLGDIYSLHLPEFFLRGTEWIIEHFRDNYPEGLRKILAEIKSCYVFMFEQYEKKGASIHHQLQLYHCMKASGYQEGHIIYICKDDLRILEIGQFLDNSDLETIYKTDIETMTGYINRNQQPLKETEIIFEGKFKKNWKVEYSNYLTKLYGYEKPSDYDAKITPKVQAWNRVIKRLKCGKEMTKNNKEHIEAMKEAFPNYETLITDIVCEELEEEKEE